MDNIEYKIFKIQPQPDHKVSKTITKTYSDINLARNNLNVLNQKALSAGSDFWYEIHYYDKSTNDATGVVE